MTTSTEIRKNPEQLASLFDSIAQLLATYGFALDEVTDPLQGGTTLPMGAAIDSIAGPPTAKIAKVDEDEQLVFGWAWVSTDQENKLIVDSQGESIEPAELEAAAYDYVLKARDAGEMHEHDDEDVDVGRVGKLVESFLLTPEKAAAMGFPALKATAWWVGMHVEDAEAFAKVKSGEYQMFSIDGVAGEVVDA